MRHRSRPASLASLVVLLLSSAALVAACGDDEPVAATPTPTPAANGIVPTPIGADDPAEEALREVDHIVHEWEDGELTAEEALERIDDLLHD